MAENKFLDLIGLTLYDTLSKGEMDKKDAEMLKQAKAYSDSLSTNYDPAGTAQSKVDALANGAVKQNTQAIATLNGTGVGSVSKTVADAVAKIVADAPESFNTLKEISDWITTHSSSASDMNSQIQTNKTGIANLVKLVGTLPESTEATTIVGYIDSLIEGVDFSQEIATAKTEAISTASADATTKANKALADSKKYTETYSATKAQGAKADTALQKASIVSGTTNGSISVSGTDVSVKGLGGAAFVEKTAFDAAGTGAAEAKKLADGAVAKNTSDINELRQKVDTLPTDTYVEITTEEIQGLFNAV